MNKVVPGTVVHYDHIGNLISRIGSSISGDKAAVHGHVGGQFFFSPHQMVLEAHAHHTIHHTSLLGYLSSKAEQEGCSLITYLQRFKPETGHFIDLEEAYGDLWKSSGSAGLAFGDFLAGRAHEKIGSTGYLDHCHGQEESLCLMRNYFRNLGLPAERDQVVMGTGFKNLFNTFLTALMTGEVTVDREGRDFREQRSGTILVPRGHYQSLVKAPSFHNSRLKVIERIDGEHILREMEVRGDIRAVYFSVVANPSGDVMPREQIEGIAEAVLRYNAGHRDNPLFVIADQVYNGSILKENREIVSIASLSSDLGRMFDYTVTIVSPSKTLGYASARIGFACSGITLPGDRESLISRMGHILGHEGSDGVEVSTETGAVAAYAFSSDKWIDGNSSYIKEQLNRARIQIDSINTYLGRSYVEINDPDAGWYILSRFSRADLPARIKDSEDLMVFFMNYNQCRGNTGIICRPGCQFGYETPDVPLQDHLILRSTLAMSESMLLEFFRRYRQAVLKLSALETLQSISPSAMDRLRNSADESARFCRLMEKDLMPVEESPDFSQLMASGKSSGEICGILKKYTDKEMMTILLK